MKQFRVLPLLIVLCVFGCSALWNSPQLVGQATDTGRVPITRSLVGIELDQLITTGKQLERQGRWGEALNHYQHALKVVPDDPQIRTRRSIARIHFDLSRRYSDASYLETLAHFDGNTALNLYSEVLLKIQSYHVERPDWDNVLRHGLASMEIALSDATFRKLNLPGAADETIQAAVDEMNSVLRKFAIQSRQDAFALTGNVCRMLQRRLNLPLPTSVHEFVCGAIISLDPYSAFMTGSQYGEAMSQIEGNFVGLGVELKTQADHLEIVNVIPNGPAGNAGIRGGDLIVAVDGVSVADMGSEKAADALRGVEGSLITISIQRDQGQPQPLRLTRRRVEIPSVETVRMIDADVGYIKLSNFQKTTLRDFDAALWRLQQQGMRSLIIDVRNNPGGLLNASVQIADRFINSGVIVSTRGRNPLENYVHQAKATGTWRVPLVVLVDEDSASASEIFAAAIQDHARGAVVGHQSYGKGSVQGIFPLNVGGGGVRLTTAKFYSPNGVPISRRGVVPDVPVQMLAKPADNNPAVNAQADDILRTGVQVARRQVAAPSSAGN